MEQSPGRVAVDGGETDQRDMKEEMVVGKACGVKPAAIEVRRYAESRTGGAAITISSLPPLTSTGS